MGNINMEDMLAKQNEGKEILKSEVDLSIGQTKYVSKIISKSQEHLYDNEFGEDETFTITVKFDDGKEMDVKLCGAENPEDIWTEAVLFDENGHQIGMTDPDDTKEFFGEWGIEFNGVTYVGVVNSAQLEREIEERVLEKTYFENEDELDR
jgi:hypothetical protein